MHGKEKVIVPILESELGVKVILPKNFNSDQFGTFTGDTARTGNQLEAARLKVQSAMKLTGAQFWTPKICDRILSGHPKIKTGWREFFSSNNWQRVTQTFARCRRCYHHHMLACLPGFGLMAV